MENVQSDKLPDGFRGEFRHYFESATQQS